MAAVLDPSVSLQIPDHSVPGPSRHGQSRAASVAIQPSASSSPHSSRKRASHSVTTNQPQEEETGHRDVYAHPAAVAYAAAHPRRTIPKFGPYLLLQTLGEGEFGKVKLGLHSHWGEEVAVKLIRRGNIDTSVRMSKVEREIEVLRTLKHPNIVRLYDVIETDKYIGIILEYASGGELFDHILAHRYLKEKDACKLFAQLISGVWYIHQKKIVHRDLKLENLLLDRHRNVIITDFGFANRFEHRTDDLMQTSCGSPCYAAPELVISEGSYVGSAVDIWSCGVILYAMLAGYLPFDDDPANPDGDNINLLYRYIVNTPLSFPDYISAEARELLSIMLVPDPAQRATLQGVMQHRWLAPYAHLFEKEVDELERAALEQHRMKRLAYQHQMKPPAAEAAGKMARSQSARTDVPGHPHPPASAAARSRSHREPPAPAQEFLYETRGAEDPFAPVEPRGRTTSSAQAARKEPPAPASESKAKKPAGSFRHTIQVEYGDHDEQGQRPAVPRAPSMDGPVKALPQVPPQQQQHARPERAKAPTVAVDPGSPPPTANGERAVAVELQDRVPSTGSASSRRSASGHKKGLSVDKLSLAKIFGDRSTSDVALNGKSDAEESGGSWKVGRRPSTLQVTETTTPTKTQGELLSPGGTSKKTSRRNTLTVMVEPLRSTIRKGRKTGGETPTVETAVEAEKQPAPKDENVPPPSSYKDRQSASIGMPASTNKARKVMQWFRTRSQDPQRREPREPSESDAGGEAAEPAPSVPQPPASATTPVRTPKLSITTPGAAAHSQRSATESGFGTPTFTERVRRSVGIVPTPAKSGVLRVHHGAVDQTTITTGQPPEVMKHVRDVLEQMGMTITVEHDYKYRCVREKKRKVEGGPGSIAAFNMVGSAASNGVDKRGLPAPSHGSFGGTGGMLRGLLMRRQSSQVSAHATPFTEGLPSPSTSEQSVGAAQAAEGEPIYGDRTADAWDEVRFSVELTRLDRLNDTYSLDIRRLKGNLRSYKYLYDTLRDRADLQR